MKRKQRGSSDWFELVCSLIVLAVISAGIAIWNAAACSSAWKHSGMRSSWGPLQGCQVQVSEGRWLPADRVREIELPKEPK